jgi:hypothetical protein
MNTDPTPDIDPGERDELNEIFHHPVNETGVDPASDTPNIPDPVDPNPEPPRPVDPERPRPVDPERPRDPLPPRPVDPERPRDPLPPRPVDPERPRDPLPPMPVDSERPRDPLPPRPVDPEPPRDPLPPRPVDPEPPQGPEQPRHPCVPVDCLPAGCVLSEASLLAGLAGAMAAFTACLAVVGLYVVIRYIGQYIFYTALALLILALAYLHLRRPEDARRLRRFLAERGREALGQLWGWATQRPEVCMIYPILGQLLRFFLKSRYYVQTTLLFLLKNILHIVAVAFYHLY